MYFCDGKKLQEDKLNALEAPFYFAICADGDSTCSVFESVLSVS